jgi:EAL domain-containing protein (putative c-di-GMP-specific phosphodiesterase class I)
MGPIQHRRRTRVFVGASALVLFVLVGSAALLVARSVGGFARRSSEANARQGVDLLVTVGSRIPDLTRQRIAAGLSPSDRGALDRALSRGRRAGVLSDLEVWDRSGRIVYSPDSRLIGTRPPIGSDVAVALHGHLIATREPTEVDHTTGRRTGQLSGIEPLRDRHGVYAAVEANLPLRPIDAGASSAQRAIVLLMIGGAALLWLLLLPLTNRVARGVAAQSISGRRRTLRAMRHGLAHGEVELVYQPQLAPDTGIVVGVEGLVRWRRNGTLVPPDQFLAIVEASALMPALTDRVIDLALAQQAAWRIGGTVLRMSVNLSATDLGDETLPQRIAAALARHGCDGRTLTVEVTETSILEDTATARRVLDAITALGIEVAVDDFGTGHASIARLLDFPVRELKIDRSFVSDTRPRARTYLAATIAFGQYLGLRVVAEGVEDLATLEFLRELRCNLAQGYHISRPVDGEALIAWLGKRTAEPQRLAA